MLIFYTKHMIKLKMFALAAAFLLISPLVTFASGTGRSYEDNNRSNGYSQDNSQSSQNDNNNRGNYYYGSNIPGPNLYTDYQNTIPWFNPPYEPYQYKFHALPNGDFYFSTPGNNYLPYISSGYQTQPLDYGDLTRNYYGR